MPCRRGYPLPPLPADGISVESRAGANGPEFVQLACCAVPDVNRRAFGIPASDQRKPRMAQQLVNRSSATDLDTCHGLNNSHPNTVLSLRRLTSSAGQPSTDLPR